MLLPTNSTELVYALFLNAYCIRCLGKKMSDTERPFEKSKKLSAIIEEIRSTKSLSQVALGRLLGVSQTMISTMENSDEDSDWETHWQVFCKLYPMARDLNVFRLAEPANAAHLLRHLDDFGPDFVKVLSKNLPAAGNQKVIDMFIAFGKELEHGRVEHSKESRTQGETKTPKRSHR